MLQTVPALPAQEAPDTSLTDRLNAAYIFELLKRRFFYFAIPFLLVLPVGVVAVLLIPAIYSSEGKILVESQRIPTDLVRPTVATSAAERIQVLQQRMLTRDNILSLAEKYKLFENRRAVMTTSEIVDLIRQRTSIVPVDMPVRRPGVDQPSMIFTVGFEYEDPGIAARVTGDLLTLILGEDLRNRASRANETTRFLAREAARLQSELNAVDAQLADAQKQKVERARVAAEAKRAQADKLSGEIAALKAERLTKANRLTFNHPDVQELQRRITNLERVYANSLTPERSETADSDPLLESLQARQESAQKNLTEANQKLSAARLGEALERDQQAEKLEILEQPSVPQKPTRPNRTKYLMFVVLLAIAAGGAVAAAAEFLDKTIRCEADLVKLVGADAIALLPMIQTEADRRRRARRVWRNSLATASIVLIAAACAYQFAPSREILWADLLAKLPPAISSRL